MSSVSMLPVEHEVTIRDTVANFVCVLFAEQVFRCLKDASVARGHLPENLHSHQKGESAPACPSDCVLTFLEQLALLLEAFVRSFSCLLYVAIVKLFCRATRALAIPNWVQSRPLKGCDVQVLKPLEALSGRAPLLDWSPHRDRKGRPSGRKKGRVAGGASLLRTLCLLLVPYSLPQPVAAGPIGIFSLAPFLLPGVYAMTRPPRPGDPPGVVAGQGRPHLIPPDQLTTFVGECDVTLPWEDTEQPPETPANISYDVPWPRAQSQAAEERTADDGWLGVYLYTPHYQTVTFAIQPATRSFQDVVSAVQTAVSGVPSELFDKVVPLVPQRFPGYAFLLRCPRAIQHSGMDGFAAVVCDLTRVGGHYFATTLPRTIALHALMEYILPLTKHDDRGLKLFIGCRDKPWPECAQVVLCDGDVITGSFLEESGAEKLRIESLFTPFSVWTPIHEMFTLEVYEGTCVLYGGKRYTFRPHYHTDVNLVQYICDRLRLKPEETIMCSFKVRNLDVQGITCRYVVAVHDVPSPLDTGVLREQAQDLFVLLDFRPLGMRPKAICVNQPKLHLPTIIADFGLLLPPTFCANVAGGVRRGDNVRFSGHTTLLFYAERQPDWAATSSSDVPDDDEPDNYVAMVDDVDVSDPVWDRSAAAGDAQVSGPAGCYDSSLPADHSWNHGIGREEGENIERSVDIASPLALPVSMSQNANSATLGTHSEVEHHSGILTVAASSGVMPNPSLEANEPDPTIYGAEVAAEDSRPVIALIYVPETLPELITVEVPTPTAVPSFLSAVVGARSDERARVFPEITPVAPQPVLEFALLVAAPEWLTEHVIVLFDCRRIEQGVFAARVSHSLNRESILLAAGLPADMAVNVHVHGLLHPLSRGQRITMVPGMTISIVPPSERVPVGYDLADRLLTVEGWNHEAELPGPTNFMGSYLRVLTDAWPLNFEVKPGRHAHFREDLAHALGAIEHRLSTIASKPKVLDVCSYGLWTSSLLAATEQLSRVPFPPARQPDRRIVLFLDLRLILRGITWQLIAPDSVSLQSIADMFHFYCPFAHKVVVRSASSDGPSDNAARVQVNGQVLEVEFVLDRTLLPEGHDPDTNDVPPPRDDDDHPVHEQPFASRVQHPTTSGRPGVQPSRSRSPRGPTSTAGTGQPQQAPAEKANHSLTLTCDVQPCSPFCPNHKGIQNVAYKPMDQDRWLTSVERAPSLLAESPMMAMFWRPKELLRLLSTIPPSGILVSDRSGTKLRAQLPLVAKLLSDPPPGNVSADSAVENARIATHQVGGHWPRPPFRGPNLLPAEHEESDLEDMLLLEASFCVLTPGYPFERLDVTIMIPQTIQEIAELLQTCRRASHQELFPELVEIRPQPTVGWGFFLAVPPWINDRCVVCFDLSQWDGRVFAETVPQQVDLWILLQLADIPRDAEIDVHVPDFQGPLPWGTDCEVYLGCCISFMPRHSPPVYSDLLRMLRSPDVWNRGLGVATMHLANGYCVVTATDFFLFRLLPGREMYYRQDIASVARLHHSRLRLVPAAQQPGDVAISGWNCRAVLAAVPSVLSTSWDPTPTARTTGILDARPLLLGWMPLHTHHDWLDLTSLADGLNQSAPEGWCVVFPAFPRHWTWIWFSEGQILIAAFAQQTNLAEVAGSSDWEPVHDTHDDDPEDDRVSESSPFPTASGGMHQTAPAAELGSTHRTTRQNADMPVEDNICTAKLREPSSANAGRKQGHACSLLMGELSDAILLSLLLACYPTEIVGGMLVCLFVWTSQARGLQSRGCIRPVIRIPALLRLPILAACLPHLVFGVQGMQHTGFQPDKQLPLHGIRRPVPTPVRHATGFTLGMPCPLVHPPFDNHPCPSGLQQVSAPRPINAPEQDLCSLEQFRTLLEESVARPDNQAFFLAATLLEAVFEHLEELTSQRALSASSQTLRLQDHVRPPSFSLDVEHVPLPHDRRLLQELFQPWPTRWLLPPEWTCADLPATTATMLRQLPTWEHYLSLGPGPGVSFSVYTDGSATSDTPVSGYAAVILMHTAETSSLLGLLGGPLIGNPDSPWTVDCPPALHAEHVAIAVALLWCLQMKGVLSTVTCQICFDCYAAGWSAEGSWRTLSHTGALVHHLDMIARATPGVHLSYVHVKGHSSHPWNDMADYVAKTASHKQVWPEPPKALCSALHACDLAWMAPEQDARTHHAIPILDGTLTWSPPGDNWQPVLPEHIVPTTGGTALQPESPSQSYRANVATVNIQSLRGKCKYIEEQLHARRVNVAFLQETKLEGGTVTSQHYLRLHSRTDTHWGVAIWIHRQFGLLTVDEEPLSVDENDISFLYEGPRLLVLLVTIGEIKIGLVSGHCPHISRSAERDAFLVSVAPLLRRLKRTHLMLGGIDLNGRIPVNYQGVSGDLEFGDADDTGWSFAAVLADSGMWVPSMYSQLHCGEAATYTHPSGQQHRIDYVLLGGQSIVEQARSEVDETFDNGSPQDDHALLLLSLQGYLEAHGQVKRLHRVRYDRDKLMTNEGRTLLREILSSFKHPGWEVSPDQHCRAVECHLRQALDAHFSVPKTSKKSSYIPESVWQQRDCKLCFKRRVRHRSRLWQDLYCRAFLQWKEAQDYGVMDLLGKQCRLYELAAAAVKFATSQIKRAISTAKNEFLHQVAGEGHQGAAKILQRVKQAGIGGTKTRPISRPLPLLLHPIDGSAITTRQQRDAVWMLHFGKQEQGSATPIRDFICEASSSCFQADVEWTAAMLPTYADVEQVIRDIPRNKAAGLDNLPGEVLKAVPAESARLLLPLFLKSMVLQHQPIQWRGGILYEAFKRSGLQSSVDNYRSLFVSSYLAKTYHRVVRNKTQVFCRDDFHPLHLGSKKCAPVTFASMFVLAHFRRSLAQRKSVAVLYLDTSAAYYRIVRELAVGDIRADDTVLRLFERFGLTGEDLRELMETVESGGMLAQAGAPDALRQVVKDIHMHTWFVSRFSDGSQVCSSLAGSRPGESWADLIYAYIYGRVLCKIHEYAVAEDLTFQVPLDAATGVFPPVNADETIAATDATWADDSAFPVVADAPDELMRKTQRLCTLVLSFCEGHGMSPNLKPGKTSVMIRLEGKGHKRVRQSYFPSGTRCLHLPDLGVGVTVADQYRHLGGFVDCKLSMRPELRHRLAQASSSYDAAKKLLLGSPRLELPTRVALFETAITPTFFNIGLWIPSGQSWDSLCDGYSKLARRLLVPIVGAHRAFHVPLPVVHWYTGCRRLTLIARRARLSLLLSLVQNGPPLLWALLQSEASWFTAVRDDLAWLVGEDTDNWPLLVGPAWPAWHHLLCQSPQLFRRRVRKRLLQTHEEQIARDATLVCLWHCCRTMPRSPETAMHAESWTCFPCGKSFSTKAGLSVHFFKTHGRVAAYRQVASGTVCEACNTSFWSAGRLAAHLRASPGCVAELVKRGKQITHLAPGFGSRKRRQADSVDFTLSLPERRGCIPPPPEKPGWSREQQLAYRALCDGLLSITRDTTLEDAHAFIDALFNNPLYPTEIVSVLDCVDEEVRLLHESDPNDPWDSDTAHNLLSMLQTARLRCRPTAAHDESHPRACHSLKNFQQLVTNFEWPKAKVSSDSVHGTLPDFAVTVSSCWEADWHKHRGKVGISAVANDYGALLPDHLRQAWMKIVDNCTVHIHAPPEFWSHPLAAPFLCARPAFARPN